METKTKTFPVIYRRVVPSPYENTPLTTEMLILEWLDARSKQPQLFSIIAQPSFFEDNLGHAPEEASVWFVGSRAELRKTPHGEECYHFNSQMQSKYTFVVTGAVGQVRFILDLALFAGPYGPIAPFTFYKFCNDYVQVRHDGTIHNVNYRSR